MLESELADQVEEIRYAVAEYQLAYTIQSLVLLQLLFDVPSRILYPIEAFAHLVDYIELPVGHKIMGGVQYHLFMPAVVRVEKVHFHPFPKALLHIVQPELIDLFHHQRVYLVSVLIHEYVENGRLYIGQQDPLEELENRAFYQFHPVDRGCLFLKPAQNIGIIKLMCLLVQFREAFCRPYMVVPPLHARSLVYESQKALPDHLFPASRSGQRYRADPPIYRATDPPIHRFAAPDRQFASVS